MGLFDRFTKPKWENKDWKKRLDGVKELDDQDILSNLAFKDDAPRVRIAAINKITDENILVNHAKNNSNQECRKIAVNNINDTNLLSEIAKMDYAGYRHLNDKTPAQLRSLAQRKDMENINLTIEVCNLAVDKIRNPTLLTDVALNAALVDVRQYTLKYIYDEKDLVELAIKDDSLRQMVVDKINTKSSFVTLAMDLPDDNAIVNSDVCNIIIQNINSEEDLITISKGAKNSYARQFAIKKVNEKKSNDKSKKLSNDKSKKLSTRKSKKLSTRKSKDNKKPSVKKSTNDDTFVEIALNDSDSSVRAEAVKKIADEKVLVDLALNNHDSIVRAEAVKKIADEKVLADLALNDSSSGVRMSAVKNKNLNDIDVLRRVAKTDPYYIEDPIYESIDSYKVVGTEKDYRVRVIAENRLKELCVPSNSIVCPKCKKEIPANAIRCKYCKNMLRKY